MIGRAILHYRVTEKIGEGGMGVVYKAEDTKLKRDVAIKFLPRQISAREEERERFKIEAQAAAALNHPNIATIHAIEEDNNEMFLVMEYIQGQELQDLLGPRRATPLPVHEVVNYATQIAEGLQAAHKKGIVHRDIKSSNIMITEDGKVKIMDFGLAKIGAGTHLTKSGTTLGTLSYMSPEQVRNEEVDSRTDIWSFGVVLYEMLTGQLPFSAAYEQAVLYSILNEVPTPVTKIRAEAPRDLANLLVKALKKDKGERYQLIDDLLADLKALTSDLLFAESVYLNGKEESEKKDSLPGLAVLPFSSIKRDPQMDFLGFALADQIISALTYVRDVLVRPSSAVRKYQNQVIDAPTAGNDLQVDYILTGYYLKEADVVRLNIELVKTRTNEMVWRESIEVKYENAFRLQDIVSEKVVDGLEIQFSKDERGRIQTNIPENPLAYEYYLRTISYPHTNEGDKLAIEMLRKAVNLDNQYAPAHAELGSRLRSFGTFALQGAEAYKEAEEYYLKAIALNDELLSALGGLANLYTDIGRTEQALSYAQRMLAINPNHALAHFSLSYLFRYVGMLEESAKEADEALALEPRNANLRSVGYTFFYSGDYEKAVEIFELDKGSVMAIAWKGFALYLMGEEEESIGYLDQAILLEPEGHFGYHFSAVRSAIQGRREEGLLNARMWEDTNPYDAEVWYNIANTYALLGDKEGCVRALNRTIEGGFFCFPYMTRDPLLEPMAGDPQVKKLLDRARSKHEMFKETYLRNQDYMEARRG